MKKITALLIAVLFVVTMFAGCSSGISADKQKEVKDKVASVTNLLNELITAVSDSGVIDANPQMQTAIDQYKGIVDEMANTYTDEAIAKIADKEYTDIIDKLSTTEQAIKDQLDQLNASFGGGNEYVEDDGTGEDLEPAEQ